MLRYFSLPPSLSSPRSSRSHSSPAPPAPTFAPASPPRVALDEDEVAQAGEALRLRAAAVNELEKAGEEVEQALKRNYDAMRDVLEDLRSLRAAVKNEADPSQAAREILRRQIEESSVKVLSLKARLKKAKEVFDKASEDLAGAEEKRTRLCTQLALVVQQGAGGACEDRSAGSSQDKLVELMARMDTIRHSIGSSEEAVRAAAIAADMSGRSGIVLGEQVDNMSSTGNSIGVGENFAGDALVRKSSSFMVMPGAPSTELEVPPPLSIHGHRSTSSPVAVAMLAANEVIMSPQPSIEFEVPAPGSPVRSNLASRTRAPNAFSATSAISSSPPSALATTLDDEAILHVG